MGWGASGGWNKSRHRSVKGCVAAVRNLNETRANSLSLSHTDTHTHTHIYIYIYTHVHARTHTHTCVPSGTSSTLNTHSLTHSLRLCLSFVLQVSDKGNIVYGLYDADNNKVSKDVYCKFGGFLTTDLDEPGNGLEMLHRKASTSDKAMFDCLYPNLKIKEAYLFTWVKATKASGGTQVSCSRPSAPSPSSSSSSSTSSS